jgi:predicted metal-dependent phosphoesterase TrpH
MKQASPEGVQVTWSRGQKSEANARRLVACWNACDGIETDHLERHGLPDFAKKISDLRAQHDELQKQVAEIAQLGMVLREQRDELLAALERTTEMCEQYADWIKRNVMSADIEEHPYLPELEGAAEDARAALAKVKGGAA